MPRVTYTGNASRYKLTTGAVDVEQGDTVDVDEETAEYLLGTGEFERVDEDAETCDEVKDDGEVCGRDLPCQYHSADADEDDVDDEQEE